jgi:hypothetical protein
MLSLAPKVPQALATLPHALLFALGKHFVISVRDVKKYVCLKARSKIMCGTAKSNVHYPVNISICIIADEVVNKISEWEQWTTREEGLNFPSHFDEQHVFPCSSNEVCGKGRIEMLYGAIVRPTQAVRDVSTSN